MWWVWAIALAAGLGWFAGECRGQDADEAVPTQSAPETPRSAPDPALGTPLRTVETFLDAMSRFTRTNDRDALERAASCCDLTLIDVTPAVRDEVVAKFYNVLRRIGYDPTTTFVPDEATAAGRWRFFPLEHEDGYRAESDAPETAHPLYREFRRSVDMQIFIVRGDVGWRFGPDTMDRIDDVWRAVESADPVLPGADAAVTFGQHLRARMPYALRTGTFAGVEYWQWLAILVAVVAGVVLDYSVRLVLATAWRRYRATHKKESDKEVVKKAVRPFGLVAAAVLWLILLNLGGLPLLVTKILYVATKVILGFAGVWSLFRLTDLLAHVARDRASRTRTRIDDLLIPLVERSLKVFFFAMGVIYIADSFDVEILPLLTGLGIGGLAVAFAAKDTIENFFGSVAVILDRPFEVGDWVMIDGTEGTVEQMGLRSTRIRTFYNSLVTMPNASLVRATVDNYGKRRYRRFKTYINVTYSTTPELIESFCEGIRELIRLHPYTRKDFYIVQLNQFGAHSLDILLYCFHECPDWNIEMRERHRLMLDIIRLADRLGVEFAFPTQTLHVFKEEHGGEHAPASSPDGTFEQRAHERALAEVKAITGAQGWMRDRPGPVTFDHAKTKG